MRPQERLRLYVESLENLDTTAPPITEPQPVQSNNSNDIPAVEPGMSAQEQFSDSVVTWTTPQVRQAINLSEANLIQPKTIHHTHPAHSGPKPHLRGWPEEAEAQLEQAVEIDEKIKQIELKIDELRSKEEAKSSFEQTIREQEILANPNTGDLVTKISTAIVSALQEKSEAEVLPQAWGIFEKSLQQHAVTLGEHSDSVAALDTPEQLANEAMLSSIAAQRLEEQSSDTISDTLSPTTLLKNLRERIAELSARDDQPDCFRSS